MTAARPAAPGPAARTRGPAAEAGRSGRGRGGQGSRGGHRGRRRPVRLRRRLHRHRGRRQRGYGVGGRAGPRSRGCGGWRARPWARARVPGEQVGEPRRRLAPAGRGRGGLAAPDPDRVEPGQVGAAPQVRGGQGDAYAVPVLAGALGDRGAQHQPARVVALPVGEAVRGHPDRARNPVLHLQFDLGAGVLPGVRPGRAGAGQGEDRADGGVHVHLRRVAGGAGEPVLGDGQLVPGAQQFPLQLRQPRLEGGQPPVHEVGELQPRLDGRPARRVLAGAGRRRRVQAACLLDQRQLPVPAGLHRRIPVAQPLDLAPQPVRRARAGRLGLDLDPRLHDADAGRAEDTGPQRAGIQGARQARHPQPSVRRYGAAGEPAAQCALCVHHDGIQGRFPPCSPSRHACCPPTCVRAERSLPTCVRAPAAVPLTCRP